MATSSYTTFKGYECKVEIYIKTDGSGDEPADWSAQSDGMTVIAVGTGVTANASAEVDQIHGLNQRAPYCTKEGYIDYNWSIDTLYVVSTADAQYTYDDDAVTPNEYDFLELISNDKKFAMLISLLDSEGEAAAVSTIMEISLANCSIESSDFEITRDGDATASLSGVAVSRTVATA